MVCDDRNTYEYCQSVPCGDLTPCEAAPAVGGCYTAAEFAYARRERAGMRHGAPPLRLRRQYLEVEPEVVADAYRIGRERDRRQTYNPRTDRGDRNVEIHAQGVFGELVVAHRLEQMGDPTGDAAAIRANLLLDGPEAADVPDMPSGPYDVKFVPWPREDGVVALCNMRKARSLDAQGCVGLIFVVGALSGRRVYVSDIMRLDLIIVHADRRRYGNRAAFFAMYDDHFAEWVGLEPERLGNV